jgi:flagellar biosynthetic protein FliR
VGLGLLLTACLVFARLGAVISVMPGFGSNGVPMQLKLIIALMLTALITPHVPAYPAAPSMGVLIYAVCSEILFGVMMGGAVALVFGGLAFATEIIGAQTGRAVALQFNPLLEVSQGPIGSLAGMMATLVFLGLGQHLVVIIIISDSFHAVPPGSSIDIQQTAAVFVELASPVLLAGLQLAGPAIVMVFLVNCFIAVLARLAPSMNVFFSIGFLLTMLAGMFLFYVSFPHFLEVHTRMVQAIIEKLPDLIVAAEGG